jgi:hypothetical protein
MFIKFIFYYLCFFLVLGVNQSARSSVDQFSWPTIKDEFSTPITTDAKYILISGSLVTAALAMLKNDEKDWVYYEASEDTPLGDYSKFGDVLGQLVPNIAYIAYMYGDNYFQKNKISQKRALLMAKATAYSGLVTTLLKYSVREGRPDSDQKNSFPSGHTTTAFAFASVIAMEHEWYWGTAAMGLASFVGYSRMNDNRHYFHDVIAGATVGASFGVGLALLYRQELNNDDIGANGYPTIYFDKDKSYIGYTWSIN